MKNKIIFVRFGGLSSVRQKGYDPSMPSHHSPPARRGIYAFTQKTVEFFLLGKTTFDPRRMEWIRDKDGNKQNWEEGMSWSYLWKWSTEKAHKAFEENWDKWSDEELQQFQKDNRFIAKHKTPKKFIYEGDIWSHIQTPPNLILEEKGSWYKTDFETYKASLQKALAIMHKHKKIGSWNSPYSKDDLEVFIEKV